MKHVAVVTTWIEVSIHVNVYGDVENIWVFVKCLLTTVPYESQLYQGDRIVGADHGAHPFEALV